MLLAGRVGAGGVCGGTASPRRLAGHVGWAWALPKDQRWGDSRRALGADSGTRARSLGRHQGLSLEAWGLSLHMMHPWVHVWRRVCSCGRASASLGGPQAHAILSGSGDKDTLELLCPSRRPPGARAPGSGPSPGEGSLTLPLCAGAWGGCGILRGAEGTGLSVLSPGLSRAGTSPVRNPSTSAPP